MTIHSDADLLKKIAGSASPDSDKIALDFAEKHSEALQYVAMSGKWLIWTGACWEYENTLAAFDLARKDCRKTGENI